MRSAKLFSTALEPLAPQGNEKNINIFMFWDDSWIFLHLKQWVSGPLTNLCPLHTLRTFFFRFVLSSLIFLIRSQDYFKGHNSPPEYSIYWVHFRWLSDQFPGLEFCLWVFFCYLILHVEQANVINLRLTDRDRTINTYIRQPNL